MDEFRALTAAKLLGSTAHQGAAHLQKTQMQQLLEAEQTRASKCTIDRGIIKDLAGLDCGDKA